MTDEPSETACSVRAMVADVHTLLGALASTRPQGYAFVLTSGLVPVAGTNATAPPSLDADDYVHVFFVVTPGGEYLPLTRPLLAALLGTPVRVLGGTVLLDFEVGLATHTTDPTWPVSHLELTHLLFTDAGLGSAFSYCLPESLLARTHATRLMVTTAKRPPGWPA